MALPTYGTMGVDWEERVNFDRLRRDRLARVTAEEQPAPRIPYRPEEIRDRFRSCFGPGSRP